VICLFLRSRHVFSGQHLAETGSWNSIYLSPPDIPNQAVLSITSDLDETQEKLSSTKVNDFTTCTNFLEAYWQTFLVGGEFFRN
jgi:hypothetical protein